MKRVSHNHGPDEGRGTACGEWPTGHCIIQELTARAEAAESKVEAVRALHRKVHEFGRQYVCAECSPIEDNLYLNIVKYPCPTIRALKRTS